jgi:hypothetical protein
MNEGVIALAPARFSIGGVLADSLSIIGRNFVNFGIVAMVLQLPWLLAPLIGADTTRISDSAVFDCSNEVFKPLVGLIARPSFRCSYHSCDCHLLPAQLRACHHRARATGARTGDRSGKPGVWRSIFRPARNLLDLFSCHCNRKDRSYCWVGAQHGTQQGPSLGDLRSPAHSGCRAPLYLGSCLGIGGH